MEKVFLHLKSKDIKTMTLINQLPEPYRNTQCANKSKILGHVMTSGEKLHKQSMIVRPNPTLRGESSETPLLQTQIYLGNQN